MYDVRTESARFLKHRDPKKLRHKSQGWTLLKSENQEARFKNSVHKISFLSHQRKGSMPVRGTNLSSYYNCSVNYLIQSSQPFCKEISFVFFALHFRKISLGKVTHLSERYPQILPFLLSSYLFLSL